ncbi:MAG: shikimate dehydrogenase [Myxococcaceae bacterium]
MSELQAVQRPRRVVTLPPMLRGDAALDFIWDVKARGAEVIEVRTDLHDASERVDHFASVMDVLVSERGKPLPELWLAAATYADVELELGSGRPQGIQLVLSHHAKAPMTTVAARALWDGAEVPADAWIKHVEPIDTPADGVRLVETQAALRAAFGSRVTVLGTGRIALPFRAVLAQQNAFDYLAVDPRFVAAPGQRLLDDAVREAKAAVSGPRKGILGSRIGHSRSPRIHRQPFDRIDLPADAPVGELVDALRPFYVGFAVTSPFKKVLASHVGATTDAINTLYRRNDRWSVANTDVDGARAVLEALGAKQVTALGEGGATWAIRTAAADLGIALKVLRREGAEEAPPISGAAIWTWPDNVPAPTWLRFDGARVAVIAYGAPARRIATEIALRGGIPVRLGPRWLIAQARTQRQLWGRDT